MYDGINPKQNIHFRPTYSYYSEEQDESVSLLVIDSIVDIIFFIDIIFNFHTSFVSNSGEVITNEKKIRRYGRIILSLSIYPIIFCFQFLFAIRICHRFNGMPTLRCSQCFQSKLLFLHKYFQHFKGNTLKIGLNHKLLTMPIYF